MKLINWERKGNFNSSHESYIIIYTLTILMSMQRRLNLDNIVYSKPDIAYCIHCKQENITNIDEYINSNNTVSS